MLRRTLTRLLLGLLVVCLLVSAAAAQGKFVSGFGSGGAVTYPLSAGETVIGADIQDTYPLQDNIIVLIMRSSPKTYVLRRFDRFMGAIDTNFGGTGLALATQSGAIVGGAIAVRGGGNYIYVVGQGGVPNNCSIIRFPPNGTGTWQIAPINLPAPFTNCNMTSAQIDSGKLYLFGVSTNTSTSKLGLTTARFNVPAMTIDPTWGTGGIVRTEFTVPGVSITQAVGITFDSTKVYVAGRLNAPTTLAGTVVVGYNQSDGHVVTSGFGDRNINLTTGGSGVFVVSGLLGEDMTNANGSLFINGRHMSQPSGDFGLVRLTLPATSIAYQAIYPAVDLQGADRSYKLAAVVPSSLISGGQVNALPSNRIDVGLVKYKTQSTPGMTTTWLPPTLATIMPGFFTPVATTTLPGDMRRINTGPTDELLLKALIMRSTLDKQGQPVPESLIVVAEKVVPSGTKQIWIGRLYVN